MGILTVNSDFGKLFGDRDLYFTIEALTSGTVSFGFNKWRHYEIGFAVNDDEFETLRYEGEDFTKEIALNNGDKLHLKCCNNNPLKLSEIATVDVSSFNVMGYISSLWKSEKCISDNVFGQNDMYALANAFTAMGIVDASKLILPTNTTEGCYTSMFQNCTALTTAPSILPATTLAGNCYDSMFMGCSSLVNAPELPATTLADLCYTNMFVNCTSLVNAPELPATTLASGCYGGMFFGCTSLVNAPELPATTLAYRCYMSMFQNCTALTTAPELSAITLVSKCYENMFNGCTNLNNIKALFTTTPSTTYTKDWVKNVAVNGIFVKNKNATWNVTGVNGIPTGWTVQTA